MKLRIERKLDVTVSGVRPPARDGYRLRERDRRRISSRTPDRRPDSAHRPASLSPQREIIYAGSTIGSDPVTGRNVVIREQNVLGDYVRIWNNATVDYGCQISNHVKIHTNCYIAQFTTLEDEVFLAPGVTIANDSHPGCEFSRI